MPLALAVTALDPAVDGDVVPLPVADCVSVLDVVAEREPEPLLEGLLDPVADPLPVADAEALPLAVAEGVVASTPTTIFGLT